MSYIELKDGMKVYGEGENADIRNERDESTD